MQQNQTLKNVSPFRRWYNDSYTFSSSLVPVRLSEKNIVIRSVRILANKDNAGYVYVGSENLNKNNCSIILEAGEEVEIEINNLKKVYCMSDTIGDIIGFSVVVE